MRHYQQTVLSKLGIKMKRRIKILSALFLMGFISLVFLYLTRHKIQESGIKVSPVFASSTSCGDLSSKITNAQILDTSKVSSEVATALRENATAIPPYIATLIEKNKFKISVVIDIDGPIECRYTQDSIPGRAQLCIDERKRSLIMILRPNEKAKFTSESQIGEAMLTGVFWLVYDYLWPRSDQYRKKLLEGNMPSGGAIDASEKPLSDYQKFNFWRYTTISKLKLFSNSDFPFFEYDGSGNLSESFVRRSLNLLSREFYCRPDSHKKLSEIQSDFYREFSHSIACVFGKPWFMNNEEFKEKCLVPH